MVTIKKKTIAEFERNARKMIKKANDSALQGLIETAIAIRYDIDTKEPKIPVDTGNLRDSWYLTKINNTSVIIGFSANYAIFVHENYGASFGREGAGAGFFIAALNRYKGKLFMNIISENLNLE